MSAVLESLSGFPAGALLAQGSMLADNLLIIGIGLLILSVGLLAAELFVPSMGILSIVAGICAIIGVVCLWRYSDAWGLSGTLLVIIGGPALVTWGLKIYRHTSMGRKMLSIEADEELRTRLEHEETERERLKSLIGKTGTVLTDLRPVGVIEVEGKRYDALAEITLIRRGSKVRITSAEINEIKVRPAD